MITAQEYSVLDEMNKYMIISFKSLEDFPIGEKDIFGTVMTEELKEKHFKALLRDFSIRVARYIKDPS